MFTDIIAFAAPFAFLPSGTVEFGFRSFTDISSHWEVRCPEKKKRRLYLSPLGTVRVQRKAWEKRSLLGFGHNLVDHAVMDETS